RAAAAQEAQRASHRALRRAGALHRGAQGWPVQAGPLSVLGELHPRHQTSRLRKPKPARHDSTTEARPGRLGELTVRQSRELALHAVHPREIPGHAVVAALLTRGQAKAAPGEVVAAARTAQVDDRGEVLLLARRVGDDA